MAEDEMQNPPASAVGDREDATLSASQGTDKTEKEGDVANKDVDDAKKDVDKTDTAVDATRIFPAVRRAFALGWSLVELQGRIQAERGEVEQRGMRVASLWRVSLSKIALIHAQVFPLIGTDQTFYAPRENLPKYLFPPAGEGDYTQFSLLDPRDDRDVKLAGFKLYDVTRRAINCLALLYVDPNDSLDSSRITRLQAALATAVRDEPKKASAADGRPVQEGAENEPTDQLTAAAAEQARAKDQSGAQQGVQLKPKDEITVLVGKFLDAWDGFLREHYYAGGMLPGNDLESIAYEAGRSMALLSWSITKETLEWERSLERLCGHKPVPIDNKDVLETRRAATLATVRDDGVRRAWEHAFRQDFIIRLQHDVVALSSKLDEAHHAQRTASGAAAAQGNSTELELPSVSIRAIKEGLEFWRRAVMKTLDAVPKNPPPAKRPESHASQTDPAEHGTQANTREAGSVQATSPPAAEEQPQRALTASAQEPETVGLHRPDEGKPAVATTDAAVSPADIEQYATRYGWSPAMRLALTKQVNIWQTLISGQQSLRAFSTESVAQKLVNEVWAEIQGHLSEDIGQAVHRAQSAALALAKEAGSAIEDVFSAAKSFLLPLGIFVLLILVACALLFFHRPGAEAAAPVGMAGVWAAGAAVYKWLGFSRFADKTKSKLNEQAAKTGEAAVAEGAQGSGIAQQLGSLAHSVTAEAAAALKTGFAQVQTELDDLNRSVSVAYPLVDYIAIERTRLSEAGGTANAGDPAHGANFLKEVIWTSEERAEEIKAVLRATLGPAAVLAYSASQSSKKLP